MKNSNSTPSNPDKKDFDLGPGPASVTGDTKGSFAAEGGYGPGPMGRGPYSQPNTYASNRANRTGDVKHYTPEQIEAAEESNREGNKERARINDRLEGQR